MKRRDFLLAGGAGAFVLGTAPRAWAQQREPLVMSGPNITLDIGAATFNFTGAARRGTVVNGQIPGPLLRLREGDLATIRVRNHLTTSSSIHWHGLIVPADMDGVPGLSFDGIPAGGEFEYQFKVNQYGTYWYHAHTRFQEQTGLYGPMIIEPRGRPRFHADREHVLLLSDWTDLDPERIYATLKKQSDYFNFGKRTVGDFIADARSQGFSRAVADRRMWGEMRMTPTDIVDVSGYAYTYLLNGVAPTGNWTGTFNRGERVLLRVINGSSMSIFDVRIPGLKLTVVAADGQDVEPVTVDEFRIAAAETYDVIVEPAADTAYTIFAQSIDRSGYARGTLAPRHGMIAAVPPLDPRPLLTMEDMGMSHGDHAAHGAPTAQAVDHSTMDHSKMDHAAMGHTAPAAPTNGPLVHARAEYGPTVDSRADQVKSSLDDPGVGLRDSSRRVLRYSDLTTIGGPIDKREPGREIVLHLTGHMERFIWSFNGQKFSEAVPLEFDHGERLRITLVNDSMMTHPIHLHGMWSEVEAPGGAFQVRKHTVVVHPAQRVSYAVTADALGNWAYHCHLLYHMEAGMFREVSVAPAGRHRKHHS